MNVTQYVMAYEVEHDRLRAIIPEGFTSLRPVLRINAEIRNGTEGYIEFNTAVEKDGIRGWLNIGFWNDVSFEKNNREIHFKIEFLEISFTEVGITGSCPAEKDNSGCFFIGKEITFSQAEIIDANKEFCDCEFKWLFTDTDAHGVSTGKTLPAHPSEIKTVYPKEKFTAKNAAKIICNRVLGAYSVEFKR